MKTAVAAILLPLLSLALSVALPEKGRACRSLNELVRVSDNAVWGRVIARREVLSEGEEAQRFTILEVEGESIFNGRPIRVELTLPPSKTLPAIGDELVAFYRWTADLEAGIDGNQLSDGANALYASKRDAQGRAIVCGAGNGKALERDELLDFFGRRVAILFRDSR